MKILDFDLEGSHFIIEADISPRQEADDDMECQWLRYDFDNTQVYKETDGAVSPFQITAVAWAGYQLTADRSSTWSCIIFSCSWASVSFWDMT